MFLPNLLIALREGLEASLVVGVLVAYLVKCGRRDVLPKKWLGVAIAAAIPLLLGIVLTWGPKTLTFQAQEILGGSHSLVAVALTTGKIFWMSTHARSMKSHLESELDRSLRRRGSGWGSSSSRCSPSAARAVTRARKGEAERPARGTGRGRRRKGAVRQAGRLAPTVAHAARPRTTLPAATRQ